MDKRDEMRYQALQKAVDMLGDEKLKKFVAEMDLEIDNLPINGSKTGAADMDKALADFKAMNLTEKGDLLKKDAAKYHELEKLAKAKK